LKEDLVFQSLCNRLGSRKLATTAAGAAVAGLSVFASPASAEFEEGAYELRVDGFAQNDVDFSGTNISVGGQLGYFMTDQFEVGLRQDLNYSDLIGTDLNAATAVFVNYHFGDPGAELQPFIGANIGYIYGDSVTDQFVAGPEGGIKYFFGEDWFLFGQIEYQFFFDDSDEAQDNLNDGVFNYRLGLGVTL
jgi:outer membrane protein W